MTFRAKQAQTMIALAAILAGTSFTGPLAAEKRPAPLAKGPLIVSMPADAQKLDPPGPTDGPSFMVIEHLYDRLMDFSADGSTVQPALAESYEVSADGLRYTFRLRKDATFADGTPVDSAAVKYSFERVISPEHPEHFPGIAWTEDLLGDWFTAIETPDTHTAVFVLNRPFVPLLRVLATPPASIVSPAYTKATGEAVVSKPMGSGPYVLEDWKRGAFIKLRARKDHWRGAPATEQLFFVVQTDANQAMSALRKGETHFLTVVKPQAVGDRSKLGEATLIEQPIPSLGYFVINCAKENLKDPRVRQAMNWAIDRQNICDVLLEGTSVPAEGILPPGMLGYRADRPFRYGYDPEKARALMAEAGYSAGKPLKVELAAFEELRPYNTAGTRLAARIQSDLKAAHIDATIRQMDFRGLIEFVDQRTEHQIAAIGWMSDTGDPDNFIHYLFGVETNRSNYHNPQARALMEQAQSELDEAKRAELYAKAEEMILRDAPAIFINHAKAVRGANRKLRGYTPNPIGVDWFFDAYIEGAK
jgi:peptide/nickel transport system substrate-binding protein